MTNAALRHLLLTFPESVETMPFGPDVQVFKVCGKMFALLVVEADPPRISLKCIPETAVRLRQQYAAITPGYHLNKRHWNTVAVDGSVPEALLEDMIEASWRLVVGKLKKTDRLRLLDE